MKREELARELDQLLEAPRFRDYSPNGLQVEGRSEIRRVVTGVTASLALIEAAIARQADAIVVHHGWFWKSEDGRVTGFRHQRMKALLQADINLFRYHLPLDAHPELGNNAGLARALGATPQGRFGEQDIGWHGELPLACTAGLLAERLTQALGREPQVFAAPGQSLRRLAWCSGGAQGYFEQAIALGVDAFISGEVSEQTFHLAQECGVAYFAAGHHATEKAGPQALAGYLRGLGLEADFVDCPNPV